MYVNDISFIKWIKHSGMDNRTHIPIVHAKIQFKSAFLTVFYKNDLFCHLLTTHISITEQTLSKILFIPIYILI